MSPQLGRFLSRDPISYRGGINLFGYVGSNPVFYVDPLGLWHAGDHRTITQQAWKTLVKKYPKYGKCPNFNILKTLQDANVATDDRPDRDDNKQHYCRGLKEDIDTARKAYTDWLATSLTEYNKDVEGIECNGALTRLGHMLHSWQDYYAHSMDLDSLWRGDPGAIKGAPDNPSTQQKPPSWGSIWNWGEHGGREPASREKDGGANRKTQAQKFSGTKLESLFPSWWKKCHCKVCG